MKKTSDEAMSQNSHPIEFRVGWMTNDLEKEEY
jgi:hypothetical protein